MTYEQFAALREWIGALIDERFARDSSDGGLTESIRRMELEKDLLQLIEPEEEN